MNTPVKKPGTAQAGTSAKKSGIKTYRPGDVLFNEKDAADSLFIIQKGQIRLYIPKGRGFVEIGILRAGEVIGEMAYFDEKSRRRSCSAAAIITTDVVEISFNAFEKTMQGLNPWFKTIINTLAERLRKTNDKVKALESNSVTLGAGGKIADYKFFQNVDVVKVLSVLYLAFKAHSEDKDGSYELHLDKMKFYLIDVFGVKEIIYEEIKILLEGQGLISTKMDADGLPKILVASSYDNFRSLMIFCNTQRQLEDSKRLKISAKCEIFLKAILDQMATATLEDGFGVANLSVILQNFEAKKIPVGEADLADSHTAGFTADILVGEGNVLTTRVSYTKLKKAFPGIKLLNAIEKINEIKAGHSS